MHFRGGGAPGQQQQPAAHTSIKPTEPEWCRSVIFTCKMLKKEVLLQTYEDGQVRRSSNELE